MWKKVVAPTVLVSLLWIAVGGATIWYVDWLYESHTRVLSENVASIRAAAAMHDVLWKMQILVMQAGISPKEQALNTLTDLEKAFENNLLTAETSAFTAEELTVVKAIRQQFDLYCEHIQRRLQAESREEPKKEAKLSDETITLGRAVAQPCQQLLVLNEQLLTDSVQRSSRLMNFVNFIRFVFLIAGPAVGIVCGFWVARGLHRTVSEISVTLRDAAGELEHEMGFVKISPSGDLPGLQEQVQVISTQIREVMERLNAARRETILAERLAAVGELAAGVAHELRNPLTSIKLLIQTADQRRPGALADKKIQVIQEEIHRMERTIQGLLDFARPPQLRRVRHDLRNTIQRAINLVDGRAKQQGVTVNISTPAAPLIIEGDPEQLHQLFVNLLLNGIDSMQGGGLLSVRLEEGVPGKDYCRLTVADSGQGIPPAILDRIFDPFVTGKEGGTGLGLAITRRIVDLHRGKIYAKNQTDCGAVFTVELPVISPTHAKPPDLTITAAKKQ
jgi:two-component system sensor histidine kinase HydH